MLKKPAFGKNVMGYSISEVDKYITYVTERYNSVCAESAELKRRVIRLQLMLDEMNIRLAETERQNRMEKPLDRSALSVVFDVIDAEKKRTCEFYEELKDKLNKISEEKFEANDDCEWEEVLNNFIESVSDDTSDISDDGDLPMADVTEEAEASETSPVDDEGMLEDFESFVMAEDFETEEDEESGSEAEAAADEPAPTEVTLDVFAAAETEDDFSAEEILPAADAVSEEDEIMNSDADSETSYEEETEILLKLLQGTFNVEAETRDFDPNLGAEYEGEVGDGGEFDDGFDVDNDDFDEEEDPEAEKTEKKEKTPAEMAAELDFYTDSVFRDGESFDPMTLAHNSASSRKPKYEDFFGSDFKKTNKK
jgi:hypothetical protein